jgi:hypothetical protein|tara:strand:- start:6409 stop:6777 length:369 start_codon:yes stop_codon:yes gene_type:complete
MENSIKAAVYTALNSALSVTIYNGAPLNAPLPYVDIDEFSANDWSTKDFTGSRSEMRIHVWHTNRDTCATIMGQIRTALDRVSLTFAGENFTQGQYKSSQSITDVDGVTRHGWVDIEYLSHN